MYSPQDLAQVIKEILQSKNIKTKDMLEACGLGINTLSNLNHNKAISFDSLAKIADYLEVSVDYLLGRDGAKTDTLSAAKQGYVSLKSLSPQELEDIAETELNKFLFTGNAGTGKHKAVLPVPVAPHQTAPVPAKVVETKTASTIDLYNPKIAKAYNGLTTEEQLKVQMFILDTAAASEKSNAKVEEIK